MWEYWPSRNDARDGQQSGLGAKELRNSRPRDVTYLRTLGVYLSSSHRMSSVVTTRMLGPLLGASSWVGTNDGGGAGGTDVSAARSAGSPPV